MVEPMTIISVVGVGILLVIETFKLIRKSSFESSCCSIKTNAAMRKRDSH